MDRKTIGRYEILDELGRGAMGSVLRAKDPAMGRTVALKCIHSAALEGEQKTEFRDRFFREARAAGALAHPGIVPVFDVGEDDGIPFLVMELVQGRTLADAMKAGERYTLERVGEIGAHIAEALGYAHRNGVVHRDIKPANILMTSKEIYGAERPKITDFGVAKLAGGEITTTGQLLGTPAFMAPEQFTGAPIDGRCDLFSLGVILYRMATGEQPYSGETITAVSYKIVHTDPIPPSRLNPAIGQRLEAVLLRALAKSPTDRFQTGEELAASLTAVFKPDTQAASAYSQPVPSAAGYDPSQTIDMVHASLPRTYGPGQPPPPTHWSQPGAGQPQPANWPQAGTGQPQPTNWSQPGVGQPQQTNWPQPGQAPSQPASAPPPQWSVPAAGYAPTPTAPPAPSPAAPQWTAPRPSPLAQPVSTPTTTPTRAPEPSPRSYTTPTASAPVSSSSTAAVATMRSNPPADMLASVMSTRSVRAAQAVAAEEPEPEKKKRGVSIFVWIIVLALGAVAIRYLLQLRVDPNTQQVTSSDGSQSASSASSSAASPAQPSAPAVFNPRSLDASRSGRLRLGLDNFPSSLVVSFQVDGAPYWNGSAGDVPRQIVVPAGRHDFRVVVNNIGGAISSNSAGAQFGVGKGFLVSAQIRPEPSPSASVLPASSRITLTVKPDPYGM